ncbi:flagellar assembly peptidoglycan hydrolase FlgJ [Steroidobacter sp. S1-65]|uniref:Peptidoglycan hydrolase FlgJ n=1 Tax=Steroidobacter gossypii TaxID=2805490 RepID=A0ABS1X4Z5_9GAMM|nr:flagellar assembly peptidoglycan hydrolase FlgJ [Steroidobacter gossypii]MBM0108309.1 flagellar assembly peptidoglycan hydrolase FlgJ [Steroidobacter gossypii]
MTAPVNSSFDFAALASLRTDAVTKQDAATLKEAAKQFESLFTQMMLKSMRDANRAFGEGSMFSSSQGDFYQDMFDDQIALELSKGSGLGLADVLVRQLTQAGLVKAPDATATTQAVSSATFPASTQNVAAGEDHQPLAQSKEDFVRMMWPHAQRAGSALGVDPSALVAQAALETGWGRAVPTHSSGSSSYNLFGIKAGTSWEGATASVPTLEFEDGVAVRKVERFRAYASPADSFNDYARLIGNNSRYENARGAGSDVASFASALQAGGYATDPNYAQKIVAVADEVRALTNNVSSEHNLKFATLAPTNGVSGGLRRL